MKKLNDYTFDEPTEKDIQIVDSTYKHVKENIFYVGHNIGTLGNDIDDSLKSYGKASHYALIRVFKNMVKKLTK